MQKLFLLDIDGCITPPNRGDINLTKIKKLQHYIKQTNIDKQLPKLTIYTGRSQGYVELMAQILNLTSSNWEIPFVVENGTALYYPKQKKFASIVNKDILSTFYFIKKLIFNKFPNNPTEPKENIITINPKDDENIDALYFSIQQLLKTNNLLEKVTLTHSSSSVDILPKGYNKLYGIKYLFNNILKSIYYTIAIGDSLTDKNVLLFSNKVYLPSNANNILKQDIANSHKNYTISQKKHIDATIEMIETETFYSFQ